MSDHKTLISRRNLLVGGIGMYLVTGTAWPAYAGAFPVDILHAYGVTSVSRPAHRIVTLGWCGEDAALALGVVPVGMIRYGNFEEGVFPWSRALLRNQKPEFVDPTPDFEQIALLKPDLILCVYSGVNEQDYQRLSAIAPTVPFRSSPWAAKWQEVTEMTGLALGFKEKASHLIGKTNRLLNELAASQPVLAGKTFLFGSFGSGSNELGVYLPTDPRVANLVAMGLRPASIVEKLAEARPEQWSGGLSLEMAADLDADLLIMWYGNAAIRESAETNKLFQKIPAFARRSYIALDEPVAFWAVSAPTVLSIPYFYPGFARRLAACARLSER